MDKSKGMYNSVSIAIVADYREQPSGVPQMLEAAGAEVELRELKAGDYLVNGTLLVERKRADDFVLSLVQNRLFAQCARMCATPYHRLLIIEGDPYHTPYSIDPQAIRGALLSVATAWQIPLLYSSGQAETAQLLLMAAHQNLKNMVYGTRVGHKPKAVHRQQLYFLQGLPLVGPKGANALLAHFGSLERVVLATEDQLLDVPGIGKKVAAAIRSFLTRVL